MYLKNRGNGGKKRKKVKERERRGEEARR